MRGIAGRLEGAGEGLMQEGLLQFRRSDRRSARNPTRTVVQATASDYAARAANPTYAKQA
jgi:hypothetical protein